MGFDPELLSITIHPEDQEAYDVWHNEIGIPEERLIRLEGNFWDIGEGPSGPNSEIFMTVGKNTVQMKMIQKCTQVVKMNVILKFGT